ncbi:hypothetical protein L3Y34_002872 [Caenorhabditis briggsae]|uniref:Uncharacterized protein n=1 Tax=Caenorhabditis briggsae TaxID=6238 RepID=A0AAE9A7Z4_CAEBR|nr:hypothetical protein L3Y34_002872 [Caenorhabditis briggsae]
MLSSFSSEKGLKFYTAFNAFFAVSSLWNQDFVIFSISLISILIGGVSYLEYKKCRLTGLPILILVMMTMWILSFFKTFYWNTFIFLLSVYNLLILVTLSFSIPFSAYILMVVLLLGQSIDDD